MCFYFRSLPDYRGGTVIAELKRGDEIVVKKGFGYPPAEEDTIEIIAAVDGMSALTTSARMLACNDGCGIEATGNYFNNFEISPEAQMILEKLALQKAPEGRYRVINGTAFDENWVLVGDFDTPKKAKAIARALAKPTRKMFVYDDQGQQVYEF